MFTDTIEALYKDRITDEDERRQRAKATLEYSVCIAERLYEHGTIDAELLQTLRNEAAAL